MAVYLQQQCTASRLPPFTNNPAHLCPTNSSNNTTTATKYYYSFRKVPYSRTTSPDDHNIHSTKCHNHHQDSPEMHVDHPRQYYYSSSSLFNRKVCILLRNTTVIDSIYKSLSPNFVIIGLVGVVALVALAICEKSEEARRGLAARVRDVINQLTTNKITSSSYVIYDRFIAEMVCMKSIVSER